MKNQQKRRNLTSTDGVLEMLRLASLIGAPEFRLLYVLSEGSKGSIFERTIASMASYNIEPREIPYAVAGLRSVGVEIQVLRDRVQWEPFTGGDEQ